MSPSIMSSNNILASVTYKIKESFEKNRYELIKRLNVAEKAFKEYNEGTDTLRDNPAKFNEGIFQILSIPTSEGIVEKYSFISETDYAKYEKKRLEMLEEARKIKSLTEAKKFRKSWYEKNTERVPKEDIYLENPYDKDSKVVIQKGEKTILEELKQELSASEYEDILEMIKEGKIPSQLSIPKKIIYDNSKYKTLTSNPVKLKYHNYLLF
jgi:hypothetical protein